MLLWISIIGAVLLLLWMAGRSYLRSSPAALARGTRWLGVGLLSALALIFLAGGRVMVTLGLAILAFALATRQIEGLFRGAAALFGLRLAPAPGGGGAGPRVRTEWLDLELDPASGEMRGRVTGGPYVGRGFVSLSVDELSAMFRAAQGGDPQGALILEAYLDRTTQGTWRPDGAAGAPASGGPLSRAEALRVLGLDDGASAAEIIAAHRRLMKAVHPDTGGSSVLAAQINAAKAALLGAA